MKTRAEVIQDLQAIVQTDRYRWADTAWARAVSAALTAFNRDRPLTMTGELTLKAGKAVYAADDCLIRYLGTYWGSEPEIPTWERQYPGALPRVAAIKATSGMCLHFTPPPNYRHLNLYGSHFEYLYTVGHVLTESDCSLLDDDYDLFITRALAALMRDLVAAQVTDPVQLHRGLGGNGNASMPTNSTPLAAYNALMEAYREVVGGY